jgi:hypothetical protein
LRAPIWPRRLSLDTDRVLHISNRTVRLRRHTKKLTGIRTHIIKCLDANDEYVADTVVRHKDGCHRDGDDMQQTDDSIPAEKAVTGASLHRFSGRTTCATVQERNDLTTKTCKETQPRCPVPPRIALHVLLAELLKLEWLWRASKGHTSSTCRFTENCTEDLHWR